METQRKDTPAYEVAPTHPLPFVTTDDGGSPKRVKAAGGWGPRWAKEMPQQAMFNACIKRVDRSCAFKGAVAFDALPDPVK